MRKWKPSRLPAHDKHSIGSEADVQSPPATGTSNNAVSALLPARHTNRAGAPSGRCVKPATSLLELGAGFAFVGRRYRLVGGGDEFFIDQLFYHLKLRSYVSVRGTHRAVGRWARVRCRRCVSIESRKHASVP